MENNLDKVSEKTIECSESNKTFVDRFHKREDHLSPVSPQSELESQLGISKQKIISGKTSVSNFVSFKDSNFGINRIPEHTMSQQERGGFQNISVSENSECCKTEGFENDDFSSHSTFKVQKKNIRLPQKLNKDPSLVFKSKAERVIIFEEDSNHNSLSEEESKINKQSFCFKSDFSTQNNFSSSEDKIDFLTQEILKKCKKNNLDYKSVRNSVKMILSMPKE